MKKRRAVVALIVVVAALVALLPAIAQGTFVQSFGLQLMVWIVLAVSWNMFSGAAGYPSFAHGVFFGVGVYTTSTLLTKTDIPLAVIIPLSGLASAAIAGLLGAAMFASTRFRADLFGLVTLAVAFVIATIVSNVPLIDGGVGVPIREAVEETFIENDLSRIFYLILAITVITVITSYLVSQSRWGSALAAIHDDEQVAESLGVATYRYKVGTFALSAGFAGLIGAPHALFLGYVEVGAVFTLTIPLYVIMMSIIGGTSVWYGPIIGAILIVGARESLAGVTTGTVAQIIIGLMLIVVIVILPQGIGGYIRKAVSSSRGSRKNTAA